jgi:small-conductance mechanosensitive channel
VIWAGIKIFRTIVLNRLHKLANKTSNDADDQLIDTLDRIGGFFYAYLSLYLTLKSLTVSDTVDKALNAILLLFITLEVVKVSGGLIEYTFNKSNRGEPNPTAINGIRLALGIAIWVIGLLMILSNLGFEITALATSLGIGGIAVALAAQNILGDLFSSFSIYFDKPFKIGDFIIIGDDLGTVKKIGLKTTRIQTLRGEELVVSNQELTSTRILNFKKMHKRRIVFAFGVEYGTPAEKLEKIPGMVKEIIEKAEYADYDRAHFSSFGASSLDYEIVYYVTTPEYNDYMDTQQEINLSIVRAFEQEGISMAFPSRTLYVRKEEEPLV